MAVLVSGSDHWSASLYITLLSVELFTFVSVLGPYSDRSMSVAGEMTGVAQHYYNNQKISLCQTIIVKMGTSLSVLQCFITARRERYFHKRYVQNSWSLSVAKSLDHCTVDDQGVIADFGCRRIFSFVFGRLTPVSCYGPQSHWLNSIPIWCKKLKNIFVASKLIYFGTQIFFLWPRAQ